MRYDAFAVEVYEKSASLCLTARNFPELLKSLISLVNVVYPEHLKSARSHSRSLSNRATHTSYLLLYFACYSRSASEFMGIYRSLPLDLQLHDRVQFALTVLRAIRRCDYVRLRDIWDTAQAEDRVFLEDVLASQRQKTFGVLRKAYYTYPTKMLQKYLVFSTTEEMTDFLGKNLGEESLAERIKGETVHLRIPKRR
ncbi:hypothetical protein BC832DRAFT_545135 [Gaertneriomyces semiglobifer]|nr:hypothetical protein BC832DRAFT_545135 [Gaertneriomyces semiglobifer]